MNNKQYSRLLRGIALFIPLIVGLWACTQERVPQSLDENKAEDDSFTITMGLSAEGLTDVSFRSVHAETKIETPSDIKSLRFLVFDERGMFLYSREAVLEGEEELTGKRNEDFLPEKQGKELKRAKKFSITLFKSARPRRIHCVANYDWKGFEQDYFITGVSEGGLIPKLQTSFPNFSSPWCYLQFDSLTEETLNNKVIVLLRNYAEITVERGENGESSGNVGAFTLEHYTVCNYPKSGTVAPFSYNSVDHTYTFPYEHIVTPTVVSNEEVIRGDQESDLREVGKPFPIYEWLNSDHKTCVIIKGQRTDKNGHSLGSRYYKVDIVKNEQNGTKSFLPILRNHRYKVVIHRVLSDGYATLAEALAAPAGNNVFASVQLESYPAVSDGLVHLSVAPIATYAVVENTTLEWTVEGNKEGGTTLEYYPDWEQNKDVHVGALEKTASGFQVKVVSMPKDGSHKEYHVTVVAKGKEGTTVSRTVTFTLRPPFPFEASISGQSNGDKRLSFKLNDKILPSILPFELLIESENLTPRNNDPENKLLLEFKGQKIYYKYMVKDASKLGKTIELDFVQNKSHKPSSLTLSSKYHQTQKVSIN